MPLSSSLRALCEPRPSAFSSLPSSFASRPQSAGRVHPRRRHRRNRRQSYRRQCVRLSGTGKWLPRPSRPLTAAFRSLTGGDGRFFLVVSAKSFRQLHTPDFYAGRLDSVERNLVLEPEWVRESIVVTATGTPTPQPQTSAATSVLGPLDLALRYDLVSPLRLMPGTTVAQDGQLGAQSSLFVRGGDSDSNKILLDGVSIGDMGGRFDFGPLSTTAVESCRSLSRTQFESVWRRCGQWRRQHDHASRHHQLPFPAFPGRCGQLPHFARRTRSRRRPQ